MSKEQTSVPDIFRRALDVAREHPEMSLGELRRELLREFEGRPMPSLLTLTIPEQDHRAPEEDWTAGLSIIGRGIQKEDWREIMNGILLSLEQTRRYERDRGHLGQADHWHDRTVGIEGALRKGVSKWMPDELMKLAERKSREP
jgi:hypothetical protein